MFRTENDRMGMKMLAAAGLGLLGLGCAMGSHVLDYSKGLSPTALRGLREEAFPKIGEWQVVPEGITNVIPRDARMEDVVRCVDGLGVSLAILGDVEARNLIIEARVGFEGPGSPCVVFRVQEKDGVVRSMYSLAVFGRGMNLWCLQDGKWNLVHREAFSVPPLMPHLVRVTVKGDLIAAELDEHPFFKVRDKSLRERGGVGICGREGPCFFEGLKVKVLD